jgi:hypothetical protein
MQDEGKEVAYGETVVDKDKLISSATDRHNNFSKQ